MLELEAIGLQVKAPALKDELFTLQIITKFFYAIVERIALLLVGGP
jgi:hypothetical protein